MHAAVHAAVKGRRVSPEKSILLIEDSEDDVAVTVRALRQSGVAASVVVITDGIEALQYLKTLHDGSEISAMPAAIFLDLRLPRIDGMQVLQAIRSDPATKAIPVVVVSSTQRTEEIEECYERGANSFISKRYGHASPGLYMVDAIRYWIELNDTPNRG